MLLGEWLILYCVGPITGSMQTHAKSNLVHLVKKIEFYYK